MYVCMYVCIYSMCSMHDVQVCIHVVCVVHVRTHDVSARGIGMYECDVCAYSTVCIYVCMYVCAVCMHMRYVCIVNSMSNTSDEL